MSEVVSSTVLRSALIGIGIAIAGMLGGYVFFIFFPGIALDMKNISASGYVIEGCQNKPDWFEKGTVYDCNSWSRQRYLQHVDQDFKDAEVRERGY